jgi:SAM-dependent methyltransferase
MPRERVARSTSRMCCPCSCGTCGANCRKMLRSGFLPWTLRLPNCPTPPTKILVFSLLHEQPPPWRERTLREVLRVVKPGGKIVIVDYALPHWWHPLRYLWRPPLAKLEPFALDLWHEEIADWLPQYSTVGSRKQVFFGGLYQKLVLTRREPSSRSASCGASRNPTEPRLPRHGTF